MRKHVRAALLGCAMGFAAAVQPGCGCGGSTNDCSTTCTGCCDSSGKCQPGDAGTACGHNGFACASCGNGTVCSASGTCATSSCTGCVDTSGQCRAGTELTACGTDGGACAACNASETCFEGVCQPIGTCTQLDGGCLFGTECCSNYCDSSMHCAQPGFDAGLDGGRDAGGADAGMDAGADAGGCVHLSFAPAGTYPTGGALAAVASGDLNGDGWADVAAVDRTGNAVRIFYNQHDGGFVATSPLTVGTSPAALALADFNGDQKLDIAVTNAGDGTVSLLINQGDGGFSSAVAVSPGGAQGLAAGDWNGDGLADVVVSTNLSNSANLLLSDAGTLTFASSADAGNGAWACALTSGAAPSALVVSKGDGALHVLGNAGTAFGAALTLTVGGQPIALAPGPLSAPGSADVAILDLQGQTVGVWVADAGTFSKQWTFGVQAPSSVRVADMNVDGRADLVVASALSGFAVYLRDGGSFSDGGYSGTRADDVTVADFNGDGLPDVATVNVSSGQLSIYLNTCGP